MSTFIERAKTTCCLGGAIVTISSLPRAVPIVHSSGGCAQVLANAYNSGGGYKGSGYCGGTMTPTSNIIENNIVFGGEDRLQEQIAETIRVIDADLYFVVSGCQVEIIGDDAVGVAQRFKDSEAPVLAASTPGFLGNSFKGYDIVLSTIAAQFVEKKGVKEKKTVNILGIVPGQDVFYKGNIAQIERLLNALGIRVNTFFGDGESVEKIRNYGNASLTVVFSEHYGINAAKAFEEVHGIPYITADLPIGGTRTDAFLYKVGERLGVEKSSIDALIVEERKYYYGYVERILDIYSDRDLQRYAIISADSNYAFALASFVADDLDWIPHLVVVNDDISEEQKEEYALKFGQLGSETKPKVVFEIQTGQLLRHIRSSWEFNRNDKYYDSLNPSFLLASSLEVPTAQKIGASILPVAFPVTNRAVLNKGYTGYRGGLTFIEDLISVLVSNLIREV